jgi:hypothetical protein
MSKYLAENMFLSVMEDGSVVVSDITKERIIHTFDFKFDQYSIEGEFIFFGRIFLFFWIFFCRWGFLVVVGKGL